MSEEIIKEIDKLRREQIMTNHFLAKIMEILNDIKQEVKK